MFKRKRRGRGGKGPTKKVTRSIKLRVAVVIITAMLATMAGAMLAIHHAILKDLPKISVLNEYRPPACTMVYTSDDRLLGRIRHEKSIYVPLVQIPDNLRYAVLAVEDAKFYRHGGLDYQGIIRAFIKDLVSASFREGGSTITQQLAKMMLLSPEKSLTRKLKEAVLAKKMEEELTKDKIFELYLNKSYFGHGAYGVEMASRTYFGKSVGDLSLAEAAILAGLLKSPAAYSPYKDMKRARERQAVVLKRMVDEGFISQGRADRASSREIVLRDTSEEENLAPHLIEALRVYLIDKYGEDTVYVRGLIVKTTIDSIMQREADTALQGGVEEVEARHGNRDSDLQGALVAVEPDSGRIMALAGGVDFDKNEFNHAMYAKRQPGSAFKPFVYAAAMEDGFSPATVIVDEPRTYDGGRWTPQNYDRSYHGPTRLREALVESLNVVTVELLDRVGIGKVVGLARKLGMDGPLPSDLSLALGSGSVSPLEITGAYCSFANGGKSVEPYYIESVTSLDGKVLEKGVPRTDQVLSSAAAYQVTSMLEDVIARGTGVGASWLGFPVAGKTGTTDDSTDAWFVGYSPHLATGVWIGYDDQKSIGAGETGARAALPVWSNFMSEAVDPSSAGVFAVPDDVEFADVDADTGQPPGPGTTRIIKEVFRKGEAPEGGSWLRKLTPSAIKRWLLGE
jgi:1A family penicillin-binding protein